MAAIFISYRERDSKAWALNLRDRLVEEFGEDRVFLDKDTLRAGKWKDQIERALGDCNIVLVVIGRGWLDAKDDEGRQRLMSDDDVHRREIALALARAEVTVVPVLVDGATMPKGEELPENIRDLIQQQSRAISDNAAHRKVDLDALSADIRRVGRFEPKRQSTPQPNPGPTPGFAPIKNSGKVIGSLSLVGMIIAAGSQGLDHSTKLSAIFFGAIGLWLAFSGYKDIKAGLAKGRGLAITAMGLSGLSTLGMLGTLSQPDVPTQPVAPMLADNPVIVPPPQPVPSSPPTQYKPLVTNVTAAPAPVAKPQKAVEEEKAEPEVAVQTVGFQGIWQDATDVSIYYLIREQNQLVHLQEYNAFGALTFEGMGKPKGKSLAIHHPMLEINLKIAGGGQQIDGSVKQKATGFVKPVVLRKVDLDTLEPQVAALLRPLVE